MKTLIPFIVAGAVISFSATAEVTPDAATKETVSPKQLADFVKKLTPKQNQRISEGCSKAISGYTEKRINAQCLQKLIQVTQKNKGKANKVNSSLSATHGCNCDYTMDDYYFEPGRFVDLYLHGILVPVCIPCDMTSVK
ncbi:MAG: hypothetical protein H0U75_12420 [Legionella sp.]|nr:hypothetical protein [Legionella sp.]